MVWGWLRTSSTIFNRLKYVCILQYRPVEDGLRIGKIRWLRKSIPCIYARFLQYPGGLGAFEDGLRIVEEVFNHLQAANTCMYFTVQAG